MVPRGPTAMPVGELNVRGAPSAAAEERSPAIAEMAATAPDRTVDTSPFSVIRRMIPFFVSVTTTRTGGGGARRPSRSNCSTMLSGSIAIPVGVSKRAAGPAPSRFPDCPGLPATVRTSPLTRLIPGITHVQPARRTIHGKVGRPIELGQQTQIIAEAGLTMGSGVESCFNFLHLE